MTQVTGLAEAQAALTRYGQAVEVGVRAGLMTGGTARVEPWERSHHPWTNRTGDAERKLHTSVEPTARGWALVNAHGVPYGQYLELSHDGRFAVLVPALRATVQLVLGDVVATITRLVHSR